ncbi:MAG TPA: hypothetical protein VEU33_05415 [Archangium sp.]|nr:hypothetical protein [Archangium sp.]
MDNFRNNAPGGCLGMKGLKGCWSLRTKPAGISVPVGRAGHRWMVGLEMMPREPLSQTKEALKEGASVLRAHLS